MSTSFWYLEGPTQDRQLGTWASEVELDQVICPLVQDHKRAGRRLTKLSIVLPSKVTKDFVWTWNGDLLITERCLTTLRNAHVTGFEVRGAKATYEQSVDGTPPKLYELVVTGWAGLPAPEAGLSLIKSCAGCGILRYSIADPARLIDASTWDGSDILMVWPLPLFRFASDRAAEVIRREKLTGAKLLPAIEVPLEKNATVGPGRLSHWMPDKRARELGEPLGIY